MARLSRIGLLALVALVAAALAAPAANAGLLGTGTASYCDQSASQPFRAIDGDTSYYTLTPGGSFESGPAWTASGGAKIVSGNETYYVRGRSDSRSLYLPAGSSATTPTMCFKPGDWHLRLFAKSSSASSSLHVTVVVRSLLGVLSILDGGNVSASATWKPSQQLGLTLTNVTGLVGTCSISLRFTPSGYGSWQIDDVYLDPWVGT